MINPKNPVIVPGFLFVTYWFYSRFKNSYIFIKKSVDNHIAYDTILTMFIFSQFPGDMQMTYSVEKTYRSTGVIGLTTYTVTSDNVIAGHIHKYDSLDTYYVALHNDFNGLAPYDNMDDAVNHLTTI